MQRLKTWLEVKKWLSLMCFVASGLVVWSLFRRGALEVNATQLPAFRLAAALVGAGFLLALWAIRDQFRLCRLARLRTFQEEADAEVVAIKRQEAAQARQRAVRTARMLETLGNAGFSN